ncbi:MAG: NTP transferase domain-containing protein [Candidatus Rifleibacteriota bacterium]
MKKVKNQVIIQARMGSTRLPGKVLLPLNNKPILEYVVYRAGKAAKVDRVVVATSDQPEDDAIEKWCEDNKVSCVRGSSADVLDRYLKAESCFPCENIVRITADCPVVDPGIIDSLIALHEETAADYSSNEVPPTFPCGFDTEVVRADVLRKVGKIASLKSHREHVTLYIRENTKDFKIVNLDSEIQAQNVRLCVDRPEDYEALKLLFSKFQPGEMLFSYYQILEILQRFPEILQLNSGIDRFEGVKKSAREENRKLAWE